MPESTSKKVNKTKPSAKTSHGASEIIEGQETNAALTENIKRLNDAQKAAHIGNWDWSPKTNELHWSPENYRIFGMDPKKVTPSVSTFLEYVHPDDVKRVEKAIDDALRGKPYNLDMRILRPDGTERVVNAKASVTFDDAGKPALMAGTVQDTTDRTRIEEALRASEQRLRAILDYSPVPLAINNRKQQIIFLNQAFIKTYGYTLADIPTLARWWTKAYPNRVYKQKVADAWESELEKVRKTGKPFSPQEVVIRCKDGTSKTVVVSATLPFDPSEGKNLVVLYDISERKAGEEKLKGQAQTIKGILNSTGGPVFSLDTNYRYTSFNESHAAVMKAHYGARLALGKSMLDYITVTADRKKAKANIDKVLRGERIVEEAFSGEEGRARNYFEVSYNPIKNEQGTVIEVGIIARDITTRRAAEVSLVESEERYRELFQNMLEGFAYCRAIYGKDSELVDWEYLDVNKAFDRLTGIFGVTGKLVSEVVPTLKKDNPEVFSIYGAVAKTGKPADFEMYIKPLKRWLHLSVFSPVQDHFVAVFEDVTDRKFTEITLKESEARLKSIIDNAPFGAHLYRLDPDDRLVYIAGNESADRILGIKCEQFIGMTLEEAFPGNVSTALPDMYRRAARTGEPYHTQQVTYDAKGISGIFEVHAIQTAPNQMAAFFRDVTEMRRAQVMLQHSEERYRSIFNHANEGIVRTALPDSDIVAVNQRFADMIGYESPAQLIKQVPYFKSLYARIDDRTLLIEGLQKYGVVTNYELQLKRRDGSFMWVSANISLSKDLIEDTMYLDGLVADITDRKLADLELRESKKNLEQALVGLISTLALTVETRDPYTAEHQKRVTELAIAIGAKAGLSDVELYGLEMAAAIHDVGKIYVPAETLNKPGKITPVEYELVKTHALAGHNIVKNIEFGQPISEIILQHHERFNGSGYPNGLKGKEIHARARILAIADVVEAMCSHRPYRPALTVEDAMDEIEQGSGTVYDPDYAAICLNLFRSGEFAFK